MGGPRPPPQGPRGGSRKASPASPAAPPGRSPRPARPEAGNTAPAAARSRLLARLRWTALPSLRVAVKPTRSSAAGPAQAPGVSDGVTGAPPLDLEEIGPVSGGSWGAPARGGLGQAESFLRPWARRRASTLRRPPSPCASGSRGDACARSCSADMGVSWLAPEGSKRAGVLSTGHPPVNLDLETPKPRPRLGFSAAEML